MNRVLNANFAFILLLVLAIIGALSMISIFMNKMDSADKPEKKLTKKDYQKMMPVYIGAVVIGLAIHIILLLYVFPEKRGRK